jgi:transposase
LRSISKKQTKAVHGHHKVVLIATGAGAHQTRVCEQRGIAFEKLPAACPELIPAEGFFEERRKELSNRVFAAISGVENHLCRILRKYFNHP